jgi:hypothetical protein
MKNHTLMQTIARANPSGFTLNELPEEPYPEPVWNEKVDAVWALIFARRQMQSEASNRN